MDLISSRDAFRQAVDESRTAGATVGLVPTMGDLHRGHASLIERARRECGFVAVSIFVNPLQFDGAADLDAYPRRLETDRATAEGLECDVLFAPDEIEMYPDGPPQVTVDPGPLGERLEGASRKGHFRGVLTVVAKLFDLAGPCRAYFGEKDAQQLVLVGRMAQDLDMPVTVVACPTVRYSDGLALSSRNARLSSEERLAAPVLFDALSAATALARKGEHRADVLRAEMARTIGAEPLARLDYVAVVDDLSWEDARELTGPARALVAARIGDTRLIDNVALPAVAPVQNRGGSTVGTKEGR
jgi:pantoate--beta-alanine ligase